ncbi:hypothetical protein BZA05DRAFT_474101 [Tricharina praecox]|uniref:uncharacterized protein n=1 Tax=Tricharina praecox TaxID=43433 RepID=UPI00221FC765|nr:uncharacterized protein BZA05DRAFT_474101 [Tricharina praecox]KAI5851973.1 hypothetical protein BZA05DRAFT_474101 [Tricharina praecox]
MTRSKSRKEKLAKMAEAQAERSGSETAASGAAAAGEKNTPAAAAKDGGGGKEKEKEAVSALIICRNKHWRYISSFHGPWLQLPPEVLESLAYSNFAAPRPRPIDPAVFFDLVKIRRHVDEATTLAVRAASGVASSLSPKDHHLLLGIGGAPAPRLSRERKYRMRELATQKLAKAYKLDEIAASVATMQSASSLEDVASLVLAREPGNADAKYVHFFHEKIPSRMLAKCTSLAPLDHVISERPAEGAPMRTRAVTRVFKDDFLGAAADLTKALALGERRHDVVPVVERGGRMADEEMPSSLEGQLLFHRAGTWLSVACQSVETVLATTTEAEPRKLVRTYAKRALRDYSRFLSGFEYTPGAPTSTALIPISNASSSSISSSSSTTSSSSKAGTDVPIHAIAALFQSPPFTLPPPSDAEALTYHPLLTDALYSTLICHLLLATPHKELGRYVGMVTRLTRIADGYPVFLAARSPARADWGEVVKRCTLEFEETAGNPPESGGMGHGEYPVSTERAGLVTRWVAEGLGGVVPGANGNGRRRRKQKGEGESEIEAGTGAGSGAGVVGE